jgi:ribonuclease-3
VGKKPQIQAHDLEERLGYRFAHRTLLKEALTHASSRGPNTPDNERLEFLGDRVLGLAMAALLIERFPEAREGDLARRFNMLVRRETCAKVARALDLGPHLIMTPGEVHSGGRKKLAILADACEAILGAVFRDGGFEPARAIIARLWSPYLDLSGTDAKTALQEFVQSQKLDLPHYRKVEVSGADHEPRFVVEVRVCGLAPAQGTGPNVKKAAQAAAEAILLREGVWTSAASERHLDE